MSEKLVFETDEPIEIPYSVKGVDYVLKEASGRAGVEYRNAVLACTQFTSGKATGIKGIAAVEPLLVSLCSIYATGPKQGTRVPVTVVETFSPKTLKTLYGKAREISDLIEGDPKEKTELLKALSREGSPVTPEALRTFLNGLPEEDFETIQRWIKDTEEPSKNAPSVLTDG